MSNAVSSLLNPTRRQDETFENYVARRKASHDYVASSLVGTLFWNTELQGNYYNDAYFTPAKKQTSLLLELPWRLSRLAVTPAVAADFGDLSDNVAGLLQLEWLVR